MTRTNEFETGQFGCLVRFVHNFICIRYLRTFRRGSRRIIRINIYVTNLIRLMLARIFGIGDHECKVQTVGVQIRIDFKADVFLIKGVISAFSEVARYRRADLSELVFIIITSGSYYGSGIHFLDFLFQHTVVDRQCYLVYLVACRYIYIIYHFLPTLIRSPRNPHTPDGSKCMRHSCLENALAFQEFSHFLFGFSNQSLIQFDRLRA